MRRASASPGAAGALLFAVSSALTAGCLSLGPPRPWRRDWPRRFSGERARDLGLLSDTYAAAELDDALHGWLDNLLLNSPQAMRASKDLLREAASISLSPALRRYTENAIARIRVSPEGQEGLNAFLEKRKPNWTQEPER